MGTEQPSAASEITDVAGRTKNIEKNEKCWRFDSLVYATLTNAITVGKWPTRTPGNVHTCIPYISRTIAWLVSSPGMYKSSYTLNLIPGMHLQIMKVATLAYQTSPHSNRICLGIVHTYVCTGDGITLERIMSSYVFIMCGAFGALRMTIRQWQTLYYSIRFDLCAPHFPGPPDSN